MTPSNPDGAAWVIITAVIITGFAAVLTIAGWIGGRRRPRPARCPGLRADGEPLSVREWLDWAEFLEAGGDQAGWARLHDSDEEKPS